MCRQGGVTTNKSAGNTSVVQTLPMAFTTANLAVLITYVKATDAEGGLSVPNKTLTNFSFFEKCYANKSNATYCYYIAVGY